VTAEITAIVGVIGVGTMGAGIAQVALEAGHEVVIHDVDEVAIARGRERIRDGLARRAGKLDLDGDSVDEWIDARLARLRESETIAGLATEVDVAIEAALEDLELKRDIFRALDAAASPDAILATNTSALSVGAIAECATRPERVVGLHFFNPAPVMKLVEVVSALATDRATADRAAALVTSWGKTPVRCADSPGFIVNRVNRPFTIEALRQLEEGSAGVEPIDRGFRAAGFRMGPFETMDLIGLDVNLATASSIWIGVGRPERLRPSPIQERLVGEGKLGRKTGEGFYRYNEGRSTGVAPEFAVPATGSADAAVEAVRLAIANEAAFALREGLASERDIDLGLELGAGHPIGPFRYIADVGGRRVVGERLAVLARSADRFRPAPALES
jgi:3-hydroxybutyryl-CoA dehydrogenase